MKKNSKDSKQMLFEMMHKVGGLPLREENNNILDSLSEKLTMDGVYNKKVYDISKKPYIAIPVEDYTLEKLTIHIGKDGNYIIGNWYFDGTGEDAKRYPLNNYTSLLDFIKNEKFISVEKHNERSVSRDNKNKENGEWISPLQRVRNDGGMPLKEENENVKYLDSAKKNL
jgi:hypothetical protein